MTSARTSSTSIDRQRGLAALEFAFVLPVLLVAFFGLVTFGLALYAQLAVSRAAEDAARSLSQLTMATQFSNIPAATVALVRDQAIDSLAQSTIAAKSSNGSYSERRAWMISNVQGNILVDGLGCDGSAGPSGSVVRVRILFPYGLSLQGGLSSLASWVPTTLTGCATVQL